MFDKMTKWTLLMVLLALINMIQVTYSIGNGEKYEKSKESSKLIDLNENLNALFKNDKPKDYPEKQVSEFFRSEMFKIYSFYFDSKDEYDKNDIEVRMNEYDLNTTSLCEQESYLRPYEAINMSGKSFTVIQGKFKQNVQVKMCQNFNSACKHSENFPQKMKGLCKQGFITKPMLVFSEDDGFSKPHVRELLIPHFCICMVEDE